MIVEIQELISDIQATCKTNYQTINNHMTNKDITIKNLKDRKKEINEEIEYKNTQSLSEVNCMRLKIH